MEVMDGIAGEADHLDHQSEHDDQDRHSEHSDHDQNAADPEGSKSLAQLHDLPMQYVLDLNSSCHCGFRCEITEITITTQNLPHYSKVVIVFVMTVIVDRI